MADMKPFAYALMLLAQRVDDALRLERLRSCPDPYLIVLLRRRKRQLGMRLRRTLVPMGR
jgi:hypothetical protein